MDIISGYAELNQTRLPFETAGRGFPLVFIHGQTAGSQTWDEQFLVFARQYRTVRCEMRQTGLADQAPQVFSPAQDLASLLNYFQMDSAFLVGFGSGAAAAVDLALEKPDQIAGLVLTNPVFTGYSHENPDGSIETLPPENRTNPPLHLLRCPVIAITGETVLPGLNRGLQILRSALPEVKTARLIGASFQPHISRPVQFNRVVLTFLEWVTQKKREEHAQFSFVAGYPFKSTRSPLL